MAFFLTHHDAYPGMPRNYRSVIFYRTACERRVATAVRDRHQRRPVATHIEPLAETAFWLAELRHHKYLLRNGPQAHLVAGLTGSQLVAEPVVSKLAAYAAGELELAGLWQACEPLWIPAQLRDRLLAMGAPATKLGFAAARCLKPRRATSHHP